MELKFYFRNIKTTVKWEISCLAVFSIYLESLKKIMKKGLTNISESDIVITTYDISEHDIT